MAGMIEFVCRLPHLWMDNNLTHFQKAVFSKSEMVFQNPNNGIKFPKKVKMCPGTTLIWHILKLKQPGIHLLCFGNQSSHNY